MRIRDFLKGRAIVDVISYEDISRNQQVVRFYTSLEDRRFFVEITAPTDVPWSLIDVLNEDLDPSPGL